MDIPRHNYLFQMRDDKSSSKSLFYGISYDIIVTFSRIQVEKEEVTMSQQALSKARNKFDHSPFVKL